MAANWIPKIVYASPPVTITFDFPPKGPSVRGSQIRQVGRITKAKSGAQQTMTDFIEEVYNVRFSLVSESIKDELRTFFITHAFLGKSFTYQFDKDDVATARTVKLDRSGARIKLKEQLASDVDKFRYEIRFKMREVIG